MRFETHLRRLRSPKEAARAHPATSSMELPYSKAIGSCTLLMSLAPVKKICCTKYCAEGFFDLRIPSDSCNLVTCLRVTTFVQSSRHGCEVAPASGLAAFSSRKALQASSPPNKSAVSALPIAALHEAKRLSRDSTCCSIRVGSRRPAGKTSMRKAV